MRTLGALLIVLLPASQAATPPDRYTLDDVLARAGQYTVDYGEAAAECSCGGALRTASRLARRPRRQAGTEAPDRKSPSSASSTARSGSPSATSWRSTTRRFPTRTAGSSGCSEGRRRHCWFRRDSSPARVPASTLDRSRAISTFRRRRCTSCIRSIGPIADSTRNARKCSTVSASG